MKKTPNVTIGIDSTANNTSDTTSIAPKATTDTVTKHSANNITDTLKKSTPKTKDTKNTEEKSVKIIKTVKVKSGDKPRDLLWGRPEIRSHIQKHEKNVRNPKEKIQSANDISEATALKYISKDGKKALTMIPLTQG